MGKYTAEQELENINSAIENTPEASNESIAQYINSKVKWEFTKDILIKPLAPIMIEREFETPVVSEVTVEDGEQINEYNETKKEIKTIESNFAEGIVLSTREGDWGFKVGDTVIYNRRFSVEFDLLKDSVLIKPYDIIGKKK